MSYAIESNICALVLFNLLNSLRKSDKMLGKPRIISYFAARLINAIKHEYSFKSSIYYTPLQVLSCLSSVFQL